MVSPEAVAALTRVTPRTVYQSIEAGQTHFTETPAERSESASIHSKNGFQYQAESMKASSENFKFQTRGENKWRE